MRAIASALILASAASTALAHGYVSELYVGGKWYPGSEGGSYKDGSPLRPPPSDLAYVPFWNAFDGSAGVACGWNGVDPVQVTAEINAGESVTVRWKGDRGWPGTAQDWWGHYEGPIVDYLMPCDGECTKWSANDQNARVVKIAEAGLDTSQPRPDQGFWPTRPSGAGMWAQDKMSRQQESWWEIKIPEWIAPGEYILRHELISLQTANEPNGSGHTWPGGAQMYPVCIQLKINGNGNVTPDMKPVRQLYTADILNINIYDGSDGITSYKIPGPPVFTPKMKRHTRRAEQLGHHAQ